MTSVEAVGVAHPERDRLCRQTADSSAALRNDKRGGVGHDSRGSEAREGGTGRRRTVVLQRNGHERHECVPPLLHIPEGAQHLNSTQEVCVRRLTLFLLLLVWLRPALAADARFDLVGPKIDVRVTRGAGPNQQTLPIASVPNLQPGDRLWIHPDLPPSQSVKYLLICAFLRGTTNPPPENWFFRVETWKKEVRDEGVFITVPAEAEQAVMFMAPETGGDFATLKSAVRGRPGLFVRASQDLNEAGFEQARIERYLADLRRVPPSDINELQRRSDLLARTLALKPNADCFKRSIDLQFSCLTQTGTQTLLDDGHGQNMASSLSNGPTSDLIQATSYTGIAGAGLYSAYVGAVVDLIRLMGSLHTAQYQYIPAIAFPQGEALNLRLNTPPSFHNPKSVLVVGLPSVHPAEKPPLRPANADDVACLLKPKVVLAIEGAPLVFSTDFATNLVLHLNTPPNTSPQPDIPLVADAFEGGLVLQHGPEHHIPLRDQRPLVSASPANASQAAAPAEKMPSKLQPDPVMLTGTIQGHWGFDAFVGPTVPLQQLPGGNWHILNDDGSSGDIIAGKTAQLLLDSTGNACVHTVAVDASDSQDPMPLHFKQESRPDHKVLLAVSLPDGRRFSPGDLHLAIQQYGQPKPDAVAAQTFADPPHLDKVALTAGDRSIMLVGANLGSIQKITLGDLIFRPVPAPPVDPTEPPAADVPASIRLTLPAEAAQPPTHTGDKLTAQVTLNDGRRLPLALTVLPPRPAVSVISKNFESVPGSSILLTSADDLPLNAHLTFTLKSRNDFPRNGRIEIETSDGTLRTVLTLAPSGGLVLQDPHTIVASLDPLRSFGPSAFGALRLRAVFPQMPARGKRNDTEATPPSSSDGAQAGVNQTPTAVANMAASQEDPTRESDWMPLGTLVRLPTLAHLQCTAELTAPCSLTGSNLFLLQSVSADPAFTAADPVPDGFTGNSLPVPHPASSGGTLFVKLRDDPTPINSVTVPSVSTTTQASTVHNRTSGTNHN